jgi:hypothetical protein
MGLACERCFLLLLLACDWAFDPYMGRSPLSRPLSSQEVVCRTIHLPGAVELCSLSPLGVNLLAPGGTEAADARPSSGPLPRSVGAGLQGTPLVYLLMSIRC